MNGISSSGNHYLVIEYGSNTTPSYKLGPSLVKTTNFQDFILGNTLYKCQPKYGSIKIIKDYGSGRSLESVLKQYFQESPIVNSSTEFRSAGWLSPDGSFYPCQDMGHFWLASCLVYQFFGIILPDEPENNLFDEGWFKVYDTGFIVSDSAKGYRSMTEKQYKTIKRLRNLEETGSWNKSLDWILKNINTICGFEPIVIQQQQIQEPFQL